MKNILCFVLGIFLSFSSAFAVEFDFGKSEISSMIKIIQARVAQGGANFVVDNAKKKVIFTYEGKTFMALANETTFWIKSSDDNVVFIGRMNPKKAKDEYTGTIDFYISPVDVFKFGVPSTETTMKHMKAFRKLLTISLIEESTNSLQNAKKEVGNFIENIFK